MLQNRKKPPRAPAPQLQGNYLAGGQKSETRQRAELSHQPCSQQLPRVCTVCAECERGRELQRAIRNSMGGGTAGLFSIVQRAALGRKMSNFLKRVQNYSRFLLVKSSNAVSQLCLPLACVKTQREQNQPCLPLWIQLFFYVLASKL